MAEQSETIEDTAAGILNGVMVFLLGAFFPALFVLQAIRHWHAASFDLGETSLSDTVLLAILALLSIGFMRTGARLIRKNVLALQRRPQSSA